MYLFRFAQVFVLIVATIWAVELCRCYLAKRPKKRVRAGLDTDRSESPGWEGTPSRRMATSTHSRSSHRVKRPPHA
jgi:hypothetical protein